MSDVRDAMYLCDVCHKNPVFVYVKTGNEKRLTRYCAECYLAQKEPNPKPQAGANPPSAPLTSIPVVPPGLRPGDASAPGGGGERLQRSSLDTNKPADLPRSPGPTAVLAVARPTFVNVVQDLALLKEQIQMGKKTLYEAAMKVGDLEAIMQALRRTHDRISKRRK